MGFSSSPALLLLLLLAGLLGVRSQTTTTAQVSQSPSQSPTSQAPQTTTTTQGTPAQVAPATTMVTTNGCGQTKGCLHYPPTCVSPNCNVLATWTNSSTQGYLDFELMSANIYSDQMPWVALGLSYDTLMGNDSVTHCIAQPSGGVAVNVGLSYNYIIGTTKYNAPLSSSQYASNSLINPSASFVNGQIYCRFSRSISGYGQYVYPLNAQYYLLLGYGPASSGAITQHRVDPFVSPMNIVPTSATTADISSSSGALPSNSGPINSSNTFHDGNGNSASWQLSPNGNSLLITINGNLAGIGGTSGWTSLGFSYNNLMPSTSVIDCILVPGTTAPMAQSSYNGMYVNNVLSPPNIGLTVLSTSYSNGMTQCNVMRPLTGVNNPQVYNLNTPWYLLIASGAVDAYGNKQPHAATNMLASSAPVNLLLANNGSVGSGPSSPRCDICLKRAHGILMITAWVLVVSTSIIIARYFRTAWPGKKICGEDVWFAIHRFMMLLALALTISGFIIIYIANMGRLSAYSSDMPHYFWVHAPLGICVMILVIINPLMAAFRCHPGKRFRPIFNWLHWLVGTSCHIIALINLFFGAKIGEIYPPSHISHIAIFWILIAFVAFHFVVEIILIIDRCIVEARSKSFQVEIEMSKPGEVPRVLPSNVNTCSLIFRYIILTIYFLFVLTLWLAMVILIGSGHV